jgi:N-acetyl-gamma-glutamyl-phosphate reductase
LKEKISTEEVHQFYSQFYEQHPFVRIRPVGTVPATKEVSGSNFCDIGLHVDQRTGRLTIVSVIDNLVKGAAGQAIQNANLMNGWDVRTGLDSIPMYP